MKKILFVAIATILLATGCQKTEIFNRTGDAMTFSSEMGKLTKADDGGLDSLKNYGFKVWAYRNFTDEYYAGPDASTNPGGLHSIYDGMDAIDVTYKGSTWGTVLDYYWPGTGKKLKFYAVASNKKDFELSTEKVDGETTTGNVRITNSDVAGQIGTVSVNNFVVKPNADNDLMIAQPVNHAQGDGVGDLGNAVQLNFYHTLTKVQFNFRTEANTKDQHPVYIQNVKTSANLIKKGSVTYANDNTTSWVLSNDNADKTYFEDNNNTDIVLPKQPKIDDDGKVVTDQTGNVVYTEDEIVIDGETGTNKDRLGLTLDETFKTLDTWLLLPQALTQGTEKLTFTITYIIKDRQFTRVLPFEAGDLTAWNPNQFVKYNIVVAPNLISFSPSVNDWNETNVNVGDNGTTVTGYTIYSVSQGDTTVSVTIYQAGATPAVGETAYPDGEYAITGGTVKIADGKVTEFSATTTPGGGSGDQTTGQGA